MKFLGYPLEIWAVSIVAVFIKLQTSSSLTFFGAIVTTVVAMFSGVFLHIPIANILGLSSDWHIPLAVMLALSAENLMKAIVEISADKEWLKGWIIYLVDKDKLTRGKNNEKPVDTVPNN